jgi:hypothetical protein
MENIIKEEIENILLSFLRIQGVQGKIIQRKKERVMIMAKS